MNLRSASGRAANWFFGLFLGLFWELCGVVVVFVVFIWVRIVEGVGQWLTHP